MTAVYARTSPFLEGIKEFGGKVEITEVTDLFKEGGLNGQKGRYEGDEKLRKLDLSNFDKDSNQGKLSSFKIKDYSK